MSIADHIALVAVPIVAALIFDASPAVIGLLIACQSSAHLVGSLPFGLVVDQFHLRSTVVMSTLITIGGFSAAATALVLGHLALFGLAIAIAGLGNVLYGLSTLSIAPRIVAASELSAANARLSLPRSIASFLVPLALGLLLVPDTVVLVFFFATVCSVVAFVGLWGMPVISRVNGDRQLLGARLASGGKFVIKHDLLLPISLCAIFWNLAFAILLVLMVPVIVEVFDGHPTLFGGAMAAFGLASIAGTWAMGLVSSKVAPNLVLLFGPGSSVLASALLFAVPPQNPDLTLYAAFFVLGFGPSMWGVAQTTVRQLVTPERMLGQVNSVIQTAIYGVRPLGALIGGFIASEVSLTVGLWLVVTLYAASFASALLSRLRKVEDYLALQSLP
jgi:predicted MFS family arabinose efflux permease